MSNIAQHLGRISRMRRWVITTTLLSALVLVPAVVVAQAPAQTYQESVPHRFNLSNTSGGDGANPQAGLILDATGNLYGTTVYGGTINCGYGFGCGTVFKVSSKGKETVLHRFTGKDGRYPVADLIWDAKGNLYGTTENGGGTFDGGVVFKLDPTGKETVLHTFTGADGAVPQAGLIMDATEDLYGTTWYGGTSGNGVVFKLDTHGKETVLYSFTGGADGKNPRADLIVDAKGNLYGTTEYGGTSGYGVVFKVTSTGKETVLYNFTGGADGGKPLAGVIMDTRGNLYGTTMYGGDFNHCDNGGQGCGVVFRLDKTGRETVLHRFTDSKGRLPVAGVIMDAKGDLYGTTALGGDLNCDYDAGCGMVFKLDTTRRETVLHRSTGGEPEARVILDAKGNLYGTTYGGANFSTDGIVFKVSSEGKYTILYQFKGQ